MEMASWPPPSRGSIKVNIDAALSPTLGESSYHDVVRNEQDLVVATPNAPIFSCHDTEEAKARTILAWLQLASELKLSLLSL
jgi:hypothetical protein